MFSARLKPCPPVQPIAVSKPSVANFAHSFVSVLAGNAAYFLLLPYLPPRARHEMFRVDLGLVVDFCFCLAVFGVVKAVSRWRRPDPHQS